MKIQTTQALRIATAVALFAALTAAARAADVPQVHVKYADLNLDDTAGATVLYQRIRAAADLVCGDPDSRDLLRQLEVKTCAAQAIAAAVATVDAPTLTAVYAVKTGGATATHLAAIR